ncbi:MAG: energy-coupled thiamine transporter ThiT [Acidaminococcus intestini]|uniref:energy-coupled thiamine transporter ThiT n=1 Tax=Acidaminococcus intestini TaxID=187327 RepID=UPI00242E4F24|nr:energy-coupled thiamine transporter ThiT [Acidaminococcus intestini]MBS6984971.1 energy-coupled thiamine transporter ThiT [Acidaminococcus intestini]
MELLTQLMKVPSAALCLFAFFFLLVALLKIKQVRLSVSMAASSGLMLAMAVILTAFPFYRMPNGGSVTLGGMLPLFFISFAYGPEVGMLAGFAYSLMNLVMAPYILHPVQVLFDYPLPFMALGLAGCFPRHHMAGITAAVAVRLFFHFLSGVVFFGSYAPAGTSIYLYSFVTNLTYLLPNLVICLVFYRLLPVERFLSLMKR